MINELDFNVEQEAAHAGAHGSSERQRSTADT